MPTIGLCNCNCPFITTAAKYMVKSSFCCSRYYKLKLSNRIPKVNFKQAGVMSLSHIDDQFLEFLQFCSLLTTDISCQEYNGIKHG